MKTLNIFDPISVKSQIYKSAIESACLLLRVDDIVSGIKKKQEGGQQQAAPNMEDMAE